MVYRLPFRVYDRSFADLYDAVAGLKADSPGSVDEFDVSPLIAMVVDIVGNLGQQDAIQLHLSVFLLLEFRVTFFIDAKPG